MKKVKAFTVLELIVVMIITSVVVSLGVWCIQIIQKQSIILQRSNELSASYFQLDYLIRKDFLDCTEVEFSDRILNLNSNENNITYTFNDGIIVRNDEVIIDTFKINWNQFAIIDQNESEKIKGISFVLGSPIDQKCVYLKDYSSAELWSQKNLSQYVD